MTFSAKITKLRKNAHLTQDGFAKEVGVSRQSVYKWESGQSYPDVDKLLKVARFFGVTVDDLLDEERELVLPASGTPDEKAPEAGAVKMADIEKSVAETPEEKAEEVAPAEEKEEAAAPTEEKTEAAKTEAKPAEEEKTNKEEKPAEEEKPAPVEEKPQPQPKPQPTTAPVQEKKQGGFGKLFGSLFGRKK